MGVRAVTELANQLAWITMRPQAPDDLPRRVCRQLCYHDVVDQRRRSLVAHADAGSLLQGDGAIRRGLPGQNAQFFTIIF